MLKMPLFLRRADLDPLKESQKIAEKNSPKCVRCKDEAMEVGFIPVQQVLRWEPLRWFRSKPKGKFSIKALGEEYLCVVTFRCLKCGYLENYAPNIDG